MSQEFQVWDIPLCPTVTGKCPMLSKKTVPNPVNWNCQMRKQDGVLLENFLFRPKSQPWKNLSWHRNYPIPGWFMSGQASRFDVKTPLQGKPLSPMPPAGGTFRQGCRKVVWAQIGFGEIIKPDLIGTFGNSGGSSLRWKSGSETLPDPIFTCIRVSFFQ